MVNLTYMRSRLADMCSATHLCVQGGFGMSHSIILIRVPIRFRGGLIYGQFDVYAFEGG